MSKGKRGEEDSEICFVGIGCRYQLSVLSVLFQSSPNKSSQSGPIVKARNDLDSDMLNLFGSEDEEDLDDADDDGPKRGRRGGGRRVAPGAGKSKGRGGKRDGKSGGGGEDADEVEEDDEDDNYEGEGDDLRPEKPEPAEDWEHEQVEWRLWMESSRCQEELRLQAYLLIRAYLA